MGEGFEEEPAQSLWKRLPAELQKIVIEETEVGNAVLSILENREREIVVLSLGCGPLCEPPTSGNITIHSSHAYGNYCYDGTSVTYEELESGCFLAFSDPEYTEEPF